MVDKNTISFEPSRPGSFSPFVLFLLIAITSFFFSAALLHAEPQGGLPAKIRVVMDDNYPPFSFRNDDGELRGILVDEWGLWQKKTGVVVELSAMNWVEAQHRMLAGEYDVIDTMFNSLERQKFYDFGRPYINIEVPLYFHRDIAGIADVKDLAGFTVGVKNGDNVIDVLTAADISSLRGFASYQEIILAARQGEIRVFSIDRPAANYFLHKYGMDNDFREMGKVLYTGAFHRAVHKGNIALLGLVERGFSLISPAEYDRVRYKWQGASVLSGEFGRHILVFAGFCLLGSIVLFMWIFSLRRIVRKKTKDLNAANKYLGTVLDSINDVVFILKRDGVICDVNARFKEVFGYTREEGLRMSLGELSSGGGLYTQQGAMRWLGLAHENGLQTFEWMARRKDGLAFLVEVHLRPVQILGEERLLASVRDIAQRQQAEDQLRAANHQLEDIIEFLPDATLIIDKDKQVIAWNRAMEQMTGVLKKDILGKDHSFASIPFYGVVRAFLIDLLDKDDNELASKYAFVQRNGDALMSEAFAPALYGGKGAYIWCIASPLYDSDGEIAGAIESIRDVTGRKQVEEGLAKQHHLLRTLVDNLPDSVYVKDVDGRKVFTNRADLDFMGVKDEAAVIGKTDAEIYPRHLADEYTKDDNNVLRNGRAVINREEIVEDPFGMKRWLLTSKIPLKEGSGNITGLVGIGRDITDRKLLENKLLTMAHYDTLTALPNRALFLEKASMGLAHARRAGTQCAIIFVDLDHFKSVNDTLGHSVGDELLKDTAHKLAECIRETDMMARLGGDEFIIFLGDMEDGGEAQRIAERVREKLNSSRIVAGNDLFITASMGIVVFPHDGDSLENLLKNADTAMYAAKGMGRNAYCFFDNDMNTKAVTKMQIERGLREALLKKEFSLFYQPIVNVADGKVRGFEALLRWFRTEGGLVFPDEFIPVAEETGLIIPIGEWVLREACAFNRRMAGSGYPGLIVSVNVSVAQLRRKNIVDVIRAALEESGMDPQCLEIEVTESMLIESFDAAIEVLEGIRSLGVRISLDDFGTGYSSLVHLHKLPIASLKIDRFFIKEIAKETDQGAMIPAIIDLAHKLSLHVIAEGVESEMQFQELVRTRCDFCQGYLLSKPVPEAQAMIFVKDR